MALLSLCWTFLLLHIHSVTSTVKFRNDLPASFVTKELQNSQNDVQVTVLYKKASAANKKLGIYIENAEKECNQENARLPTFQDIQHPGFSKLLATQTFEDYEIEIGQTVSIFHGFYLQPHNRTTLQMLWRCSSNLFVVNYAPIRDKDKIDETKWGCDRVSRSLTPPDIACVRVTYPTTPVPPSTTLADDPDLLPCSGQTAVRRSLPAWDDFLIEYRYALLAGTALCLLCLLVLTVLLVAAVRRARVSRLKGLTDGGTASESPSGATHMGYEDGYIAGHCYGEPLMSGKCRNGRVVHVPNNTTEIGAITMRRYKDALRRSSGCLLNCPDANDTTSDYQLTSNTIAGHGHRRGSPPPGPSPTHAAQFYPMPLVPTSTPSSALPMSHSSDLL